ncbi:MAG: SDR family oxidoreductase [Opitutaceae bacterium]|nr:SDR family oxidoreductase [Cytophagales bacterium]
MEQNKFIVVTGGTKGIGLAVIEAFMVEGFDVATCSRNLNDLELLKERFELKFKGQSIHILEADLSKKESCILFGKFVSGKTDKIDILVNNTGYFLPGQIHNEEVGNLELMMNTNLYSAYHMSRYFIPMMKSRMEGHIFNICSTASIVPYVNGGSYCISKFALYGMTKVLREEMKEFNVRVTSILPGATFTNSWEGSDLPETRFMKSSDVGQAVLGCWKLSKHTVVEELLLRPQLGDI